MKKTILITSLFLALIALAAILLFDGKKGQPTNQPALSNSNGENVTQQNNNAVQANNNYQTQIDNQANVTVEVKPKQLGTEQEKNIFTVSLNTHSVELDFDFTKIMLLKDDLGNTYPALKWTGNRGWHHVSGDISFPKINELARNVTLQINGVNGVERNFEWVLK